MSKRQTGTDTKQRRGVGWGGKGSSNISKYGTGNRGYVGYRDRRDWNGWRFVDRPGPHQSDREMERRARWAAGRKTCARIAA